MVLFPIVVEEEGRKRKRKRDRTGILRFVLHISHCSTLSYGCMCMVTSLPSLLRPSGDKTRHGQGKRQAFLRHFGHLSLWWFCCVPLSGHSIHVMCLGIRCSFSNKHCVYSMGQTMGQVVVTIHSATCFLQTFCTHTHTLFYFLTTLQKLAVTPAFSPSPPLLLLPSAGRQNAWQEKQKEGRPAWTMGGWMDIPDNSITYAFPSIILPIIPSFIPDHSPSLLLTHRGDGVGQIGDPGMVGWDWGLGQVGTGTPPPPPQLPPSPLSFIPHPPPPFHQTCCPSLPHTCHHSLVHALHGSMALCVWHVWFLWHARGFPRYPTPCPLHTHTTPTTLRYFMRGIVGGRHLRHGGRTRARRQD